MRTSEAINEIATALARAQGTIKGAAKDAINPAFAKPGDPRKGAYADLASVWDACREPLTKNGLAVAQSVTEGRMITRLMHSSGQWIEDGGTPLLLSKQDMQGLGSALTYSRRYGLMAMVGIAPEDDDGNAASAKGNGHATQQPVGVKVPEGFDKWFEGLRDVAPEGMAALKKAWNASRPDYRQHLTQTQPDVWEGLKAKAAQAETVPA